MLRGGPLVWWRSKLDLGSLGHPRRHPPVCATASAATVAAAAITIAAAAEPTPATAVPASATPTATTAT